MRRPEANPLAREPNAGFFTLNPRRKSWNLLQRPDLQLRLPAYLLALTLAFVGLLSAHTWDVYGRLFARAVAESNQPAWFERTLSAQTGDFALVWGAITLAYVLSVVILCVAYVHRMVGPLVPLRRHLEAMKNGDFSVRTHLRSRDAFQELAEELNELTAALADAEKRERAQG